MKRTGNGLLVIALFTLISCNNKPSADKVSSAATDQDRTIGQPVKILEMKDVEYAYPHWSVDGKRILFQSNISGLWQIYTMEEDGSNLVQVTNGSSNNYFPDWSPDNSSICFVSDGTGNEEIYIVDADGSNIKQLTFNKARNIHPYWAPDGSRILFNSTMDDSDDFDIYEMYSDGSSIRRLMDTPDNETCARLAPTMDKVVYLKNNSAGLDDLYFMDLKDKSEINLTNTPTRDGWPTWMPGGKEILFSAVEDDRYKLFMYNIDDRSLRKLTDPPMNYDDGRANISADGQKIVFNRQLNGERNTIGIYILSIE